MSTVPGAPALPAAQPMYEWNALPWKAIQRRVFKLQKRIYQAAGRGDTRAVHRLQRLSMRSWHARVLAVRKVTQDNQGKHTAGVDGVKRLTPPQRLTLAAALRVTPQAMPVRRVFIPKPGTTEQRPLGIPTMRDRATQALAKLTLEPEWEAHFEPNSYGFRPGRSGRVFARLRARLYTKLQRWAKRRHPNKAGAWVAAKYWRLDAGTWTFATKDGTALYDHGATRIRRHVKVLGTKSPYDDDWVYWATRLGTHPEVARRVATLLKRQQGRCAWCGLYFTTEADLPEIDHIVPKHLGGIDAYFNLQLLHRHCHDQKTARDLLSGPGAGQHLSAPATQRCPCHGPPA